MAWDPAIHEVVMFGGSAGAGYSPPTDTWEWNGQTWHRLSTTAAPTRSENPVLTWDDVSQQLVLTGVGSNYAVPSGSNPELFETWVLSGTTWVRVDDGRTTPQPALPLRTAYDPVSRTLISVAGTATTMWSWSAGRWTQLTTASPSIQDLVTDYAGGCVLGITSFGGTWGWTGTSWIRLHADDEAGADAGSALAWDGAIAAVAEYGVESGTTVSTHVYVRSDGLWSAQRD